MAQQTVLIANALKAAGADPNAALSAAARLVAADLMAPPEPEAIPETDMDRVVDALETIAAAIADKP